MLRCEIAMRPPTPQVVQFDDEHGAEAIPVFAPRPNDGSMFL